MNLHAQRFKRNTSERTPQISDLAGGFPEPTTDAGQFLYRRHHVPAGIADLLAALAGLGIEDARP